MPSASGAHIKYAWQHQANLVLAQPNPASGVPYPILVATEDVRILSIEADVTWTGQPSPLEAHVTVDGVAVEFRMWNPVSATFYLAALASDVDENVLTALFDGAYSRAFLLEGQNIAITIETTGGTVSQLNALVKWQRLLPT